MQYARYTETDPQAIWRLVEKAFWEQYRCPYKRAKAFTHWYDLITATFGEEVYMADLEFTFWYSPNRALGFTVTRSKPPLPML